MTTGGYGTPVTGLPSPRVDQQWQEGPQRVIAPGGAAGTFRGRLVVVFGSGPNVGIFVYSPTPGAGNLVASIAAVAGTDPYGNAYSNGITTYGGGQTVQLLSNRILLTNTGATAAALMQLATVISGVDTLQLQGPQPTGLYTAAALNLVSGATGGNSGLLQVANVPLNLSSLLTPSAPAAGNSLYSDTAGKLAVIPKTGTAMQVPATQLATFPAITVTQATLTTIASATYPATDAEAGSVYELEVWGSGTTGSTLQALEFSVSLGGVAGVNFTFGTTALNQVSTAFRWQASARVICHTTGAGGTWSTYLKGNVSEFQANNIAPGNNDFAEAVACEAGTTITVDSTVNQTLALQCAWGSTTGAPTLTSRVAMFKRVA